MAGLKIKVLVGIGLGVVYTFYYQGGDTLQYFGESAKIAKFVLRQPGDIFSIYFYTNQLPELWQSLTFSAEPRALFFSKIASLAYLLTGGNYWTMGAFFSLISFVGIHLLVEELSRNFDKIRKASYVAFYFLPTFVFWTSGLLKESVAIFALSIAITITLVFIRTKQYSRWILWIYLILSLWLLWKLKYYYAAVLIPTLACLLIYNLTENIKRFRVGIIILSLIIGVFLISKLHYNLNATHVLQVVYENYLKATNGGATPDISYYNFNGSFYGFLMNSPLALFTGLFRPMIGETENTLQLLVALENILILIVLIVALVKSRFRISFRNPFLIITLGYIIYLATLLAFAIPNFGSLSRYKVAYWPFFVLLVVILLFQSKKGQNLHDPGLKK